MKALAKDVSTRGRSLRHASLGIVLSLAVLAPTAKAADDQGWQWMVAPYGWAASVGTDLERYKPPAGAVSNDSNFDDVIDKLDGAFQIHIEGQNEKWGMFTDFTYLGLADGHNRPRFSTESDLDTRVFELAAVWRGPLSGLGSLRWIALHRCRSQRAIPADQPAVQ